MAPCHPGAQAARAFPMPSSLHQAKKPMMASMKRRNPSS